MTILALDGAEVDPTISFTPRANGGERWVSKGQIVSTQGYTYAAIYTLAGSPHGTLIATAYRTLPAIANIILRSTDHGQTWTEVYVSTYGFNTVSDVTYTGSSSGTMHYWMIVVSGNNGGRYLQSNNDGVGWTTQQVNASTTSRYIQQLVSNGQGRIVAHLTNSPAVFYHLTWGNSSTWTSGSGTSSPILEYHPLTDEWIAITNGTTSTARQERLLEFQPWPQFYPILR